MFAGVGDMVGQTRQPIQRVHDLKAATERGIRARAMQDGLLAEGLLVLERDRLETSCQRMDRTSSTPEEVQGEAAFYSYSKTNVGETDREGISVFYKDDSRAVLHTHSCCARGIDMIPGQGSVYVCRK